MKFVSNLEASGLSRRRNQSRVQFDVDLQYLWKSVQLEETGAVLQLEEFARLLLRFCALCINSRVVISPTDTCGIFTGATHLWTSQALSDACLECPLMAPPVLQVPDLEAKPCYLRYAVSSRNTLLTIKSSKS